MHGAEATVNDAAVTARKHQSGGKLAQGGHKLTFHEADTDFSARILADTSDTDLKLFLWQAERHADILATIIARMSARISVSVSASWNASYNHPKT